MLGEILVLFLETLHLVLGLFLNRLSSTTQCIGLLQHVSGASWNKCLIFNIFITIFLSVSDFRMLGGNGDSSCEYHGLLNTMAGPPNFEQADETLEKLGISVEKQEDSSSEVSMDEYTLMTPRSNESGKFECSICPKKYKFKPDLRRHMKSHTSHYSCASCHLYFDSFDKLQEHRRAKHEQLCFVCGKKFRFKQSLKEHISKHTEIYQENQLKCTKCPKLFTKLSRLEGHMNTHTNSKPFKCEHCDKEFCHRSSLTSHIEGCTGQKAFLCITCGASFKRKDYLIQHEKAKHSLVTNVCVCGSSYAHPSSLYKHQKTCPVSKISIADFQDK